MLGLVADYSSDDETTATIPSTTTTITTPKTTTTTTTQTTSNVSSSSETNNHTTVTLPSSSSSSPPLPPATIETNTSTVTYDEQQQVKKRKTTKKTKIQKNKKNKNGNGGGKRKRTTLEIVSALGLDQEMDNILRHDHNDDYNDNDMKSSKRQKTTSIDMENRHENDNEDGDGNDDAIVGVYGAGDGNDQRQEHKGNSSSSALLSDDFFDTLHEYREQEDDNVHGQLSHHYGDDDIDVDSEEVVGPLIMEQQPSYDHTYNQNLQQQKQQQTVIEINAMNRGDAYLSEATKRQIAMEKHRNLTASSLSGSGATSTQKVISNVQRSRNQLSYLAHSAQVNELENAEKIAEGRANKRAAWKKYGWT